MSGGCLSLAHGSFARSKAVNEFVLHLVFPLFAGLGALHWKNNTTDSTMGPRTSSTWASTSNAGPWRSLLPSRLDDALRVDFAQAR